MKYKILKWLANKLGYNLEPRGGLVMRHICQSPTFIQALYIADEQQIREFHELEGYHLPRNVVLKIYASNR